MPARDTMEMLNDLRSTLNSYIQEIENDNHDVPLVPMLTDLVGNTNFVIDALIFFDKVKKEYNNDSRETS